MNMPDAGSMILDRKTSKCWKVEVSETGYVYEDFEEFGTMRLECVGYNGVWLDLDTTALLEDETRYVELMPLQVLEMAKHLTEQACSCFVPACQRELCLKAIWLLQWFSAED